MIEPVYLVGVGGTFGAIARYTVGQLDKSDRFPVSTLTVNVLGSFILGVLVFLDLNQSLLLLIGVGFCGAFTTYSTFSVDTVLLWEDGNQLLAIVNALANIIASIGAIGVAWVLIVWLPF